MRGFRPFALLILFIGLLLAPAAWASPNAGLRPIGSLDRATPRRTMAGFLSASRTGDFERAANYLDLRATPPSRQATVGPDLAEQLAYVVERKASIDTSKLSDDPEGNDPSGSVEAGSIFLRDEEVPITLVRVRFPDGVHRWLVSRATVAMIPALTEAYGERAWIEKHLPAPLTRVIFWGNALWQWLGIAAAAIAALLVGRFVTWALLGLGRRIARHTKIPADQDLLEAAAAPARILVADFVFYELVTSLSLTSAVAQALGHVIFTVFVIAVGWLLIRLFSVVASWATDRLPSDSQLDVKHRVYRTQVVLLRRVASSIVVFVSISIVFVQFELVRDVGLSLLASAGVAGIVLGIAAQKSLSGIIAGIQLSITRPLRIGDVVKIEGEVGQIEQVNLTYVVIRVWDQRRLVLPVHRLLEQPFENWTMQGAELLGTVTLPVDITIPVEVVRSELERLCKQNPNWDGRTATLQVTAVSDQSLELRALVSAASSSKIWDLRCEIREQLAAFVRDLEGGRYVARVRTQGVSGAANTGDKAAAAAG